MRITAYVFMTAAVCVALACTNQASSQADTAQQETQQPPRLSPHESVTGKVGEANITVTYGRPYKKGREIYGGLVPWDKIWRTGADEATTLETDRDLMLGPLHVPSGKYALFTIPSRESWTLIVNKVADQWGAFNYAQAADVGRVQMSVSVSEFTEQLTIEIAAGEGPHGTLSIVWDMTAVSVPIMAH